jgi:hypothetical protein
MKAIEVKYNGLTFRSKTEAKWALFMDIIGCKYIYEPEGYDLGDGVFYCPDFYLPDIETFLEIKPITGGFPSPTMELAAQSKKRVITFFGEPSIYNYPDGGTCHQVGIMSHWQYLEGGWSHDKDCGEDYPYAFCICPSCGFVDIEWRGRGRRIRCGCEKNDRRSAWDYSRNSLIIYAVSETRGAFRWTK